MIDLHTHLLPGLDDGARSWEEASEMAQTAAESGISVAAAACHANLPGRETSGLVREYRKRLEKLKELLKKYRTPLELVEGMEIMDGPELIRKLKRGDLLTINQTRYVLVEVLPDAPAWQVYRMLDHLLEEEYYPVLAHPERYRCVQKTPAQHERVGGYGMHPPDRQREHLRQVWGSGYDYRRISFAEKTRSSGGLRRSSGGLPYNGAGGSAGFSGKTLW
mgnify:CR=1 FL=1